MLDILIAVLLVVTIVYAIILNRRLGNLRRDRQELEQLAKTFADATTRADESIGRLRATAEELQQRIDAARSVGEDLAFMSDRGESLADRLEGAVRTNRGRAAPAGEVDDGKSDAERTLLQALQSAR
ncbi:MAG: hypothetical protein H6907_17910 [Hyphomicrobiales bacterium]|nr:hypothetical protein [Hyphomicrobiales bacterium]MCP5373609.1 hypothetical protein [Hyphomicrobiales bacterium]